MGKIVVAIFAAIIGGFTATATVVFWFSWGTTGKGQPTHIDPSRADYVDLMLTLVTVLLATIGLAITLGALVIGLIAFKTLREIKDEAAQEAKITVKETMKTELKPSVAENLKETLPASIKTALKDDDTGHKILSDLARAGVFDEAIDRVVEQMNYGGPTEGSLNND